ncbi:MAG: hypothetical protein HXY44_01675 [Syntrophaceae bacterium]|nr:hypothetical protein [Syntrophaceae bacterium]
MNTKETIHRFIIFFLFPILLLVFACSSPSWFPIKKGPPHLAKNKELLDKEVVIIEKQEYVKVLNPRANEEKDQPKYLYIPVSEYLSNKGAYTTPPLQKEEFKREISSASTKLSSLEEETLVVSPAKLKSSGLKKKAVVLHFDDRVTSSDEMFGDWIAEKLMTEVNRRSSQILFVDYQSIKEFLEKKGTDLKNLETPLVLHLLNEVFGIHVLIAGQLSGPYVFSTKTDKNIEGIASAIIKIETRLVDTFSGKTFKHLSATNPIIATKETGAFSQEKAKIRAIDIAIADLGRSLSAELDGLDWFCRIAKVDGEQVYINAGRLTGLKVGDVMEVFRPGQSGEKGEVKGKIKISAFFGIDASIGQLIQGKNPDVNDILKLTKSEGT